MFVNSYFVHVLSEEQALVKEKRARNENVYLIIGESKILQEIIIIFRVDKYDISKTIFESDFKKRLSEFKNTAFR